MGVVIAGLLTTLVFVFVDRSSTKKSVVSAPAPAPTATTAITPPAVLNGSYDVTITVVSAEYGATWPGGQVVSGQQVQQVWSFACGRDTCVIRITSGHIVEDPDTASVATTDGRTFTVSRTTAASPDSASLPAGCGAVDATDVQQLALDAPGTGETFTGRYELHHPAIHVEGPVGDGVGSCDSFNVVLDLTARRV
jgi:hypothetical protein